MTSKEALDNITNWIEYFTRLDFVEPIVRGEVQQKFYDAYHKTRPELELIGKDLEILEEIKTNHPDLYNFYKELKKRESEWLNDK